MALVAACLTVGLSAAPAVAAPSDAAAVAKAAQKKKATTESLRKRLVKSEDALRKSGKTLKALEELAKENENGVKFLTAAAPQLISGLTQLRDGSIQLRDGLLALRSALETQVAPALLRVQDELVPAVEDLGAFVQAQEYGRAGIFATGAQVIAGGIIGSADIPDDSNQLTVNERAIITATGPAVAVDLRAAIRGNESDNGVGETAGQAGGFISVEDSSGNTVGCAGSPPGAGGIFGTQPGADIETPDGIENDRPLVNLPGGYTRTEDGTPNQSENSPSLLPAPCQFAATPGQSYRVHYSVNFLDIPKSEDPGPKE